MKKRFFCIFLVLLLFFNAGVLASAQNFYPNFAVDYNDESHEGMRGNSFMIGAGVSAGGVHNEINDTYILYPYDAITAEAFLTLVGRGIGHKQGTVLPDMRTPLENPRSYWSINELIYVTMSNLHNGFWDYLRSDGRSYNNNWDYNFSGDEAKKMEANYRKEATFELVVGLLITMTGYERVAMQNGGWPYGYIKTAESLNLFENTDCSVNTNPKATVIRLEAINMMNNALQIPLYLTQDTVTRGYIADFRELSNAYGQSGGELYNGMGQSGKNESLLTFQKKMYPVHGQLVSWNGTQGQFRIEYAENYCGRPIGKFDAGSRTVTVQRDEMLQNRQAFDANAFLNRPCEALLHVDGNGTVTLQHIGAGQQLAMPVPFVENGTIRCGETPVVSWNKVPHADYYTVWDWTRNKVYEVYNTDGVTTFSGFEAYTEPGTYAIGVFARTWGDGQYRQSKGYSFNITVTDEWAPEKVEATINGRALNFDVPPQIINGRTMVPVRAIFEALGADVYWNEKTQTVIGKNDKYEVNIQVGSSTMYWAVLYDGYSRNVPLDSPAVIINGRTLIPARAVAEAFGCNVEWDENTRTVLITAAE